MRWYNLKQRDRLRRWPNISFDQEFLLELFSIWNKGIGWGDSLLYLLIKSFFLSFSLIIFRVLKDMLEHLNNNLLISRSLLSYLVFSVFFLFKLKHGLSNSKNRNQPFMLTWRGTFIINYKDDETNFFQWTGAREHSTWFGTLRLSDCLVFLVD